MQTLKTYLFKCTKSVSKACWCKNTKALVNDRENCFEAHLKTQNF